MVKKQKVTTRRSSTSNRIEGTRLAYNISEQRRYEADLRALVDFMASYTNKEIERLFKKPVAKEFYAQDASIASQAKILMNALMAKFETLFSIKALTVATKMVKGQNKSSVIALKTSFKQLTKDLTLNTNFLTGTLKETLKASVNENVSLIKSIPQQYLTQVEGSVMRSITSGAGLHDLIPALKRHKGVTDRRAKNIALDQTRKVYNCINRDRMIKLGLEEFEWLHSGGGQKPREDHIAMSGKIYRFDDLPVIDKRTGERGIPGQAPFCGCTMKPVIRFN